MRKSGKARKVIERPAPALGWKTTDEDELALRRWRGRTEVSAVEPMDTKHPIYGVFRVRSESGSSYIVEIRSRDERINSCSCIDYRVNGLGSCKHIEGVLASFPRHTARATTDLDAIASSRVEIFLDRRDAPRPVIRWPESTRGLRAIRDWLAPYLQADGALIDTPRKIAALMDAWPSSPPAVRRSVRISQHFTPWLERAQRHASRAQARARFESDVARGKADFDLVRHPLLPYQRAGMMHLAFGERALLADEMGLGKTVQAIAACELLARRKGIERVLVVCPASLKAEWEEQIAHFTDRPSKSVFGPRAARLAAYNAPVFFNIVNYEQVLTDAEDINRALRPDVVILDEAQRIKNWQTKTARCVKQLRSPYAFVLTGTPLENRIDELYSIVQYLDPELLGPLFRFNRDFYDLDERGRPVDYKNLAVLRDRIASLLLRRRKADVESQLPGRTVTNYFVAMVDEQRLRYDEYKGQAARIVQIAQRRPLLPHEFERLQMLLACMRMICDTPAILDPSCRVSPKLEELERILGELLEDPNRKVIIFSEWERMLEMIRDLAREMGVEAAWHTGSVPQQRRRAEIVRFKQDPACRLFLSTDSGSVGLNLQVANAVVNIDLPWNPAKLEQRIARAWRKGQMRGVSVVNLICEDSIEHGMLHLLGAKQALADGVLDGQGDLTALKMPSGRGAMIARMQALMQASSPAAIPETAPVAVPAQTPQDKLATDLRQRHGENALLIEERQTSDGKARVMAVLDVSKDAADVEAKRAAELAGEALPVDIIDRATWQILLRLQANGHLRFADSAVRVLYRRDGLAETEADDRLALATARAAKLLDQAERQLKMARVLLSGGFPEEMYPALAKAIRYAGAAVLARSDNFPPDADMASRTQLELLGSRSALPSHALETLDAVMADGGSPDANGPARLLEHTGEIVAAARGDATPERIQRAA